MRMKDIKLNLGSGRDYYKGFINVDIDNSNKVDVEADLNKKFPFKDNYAAEIKASDILEHFTKEDAEKFLVECYRVLIPGGKIFIRTHNVFQIFKQFNSDPLVLMHFLYGDTSAGIPGSHKYAYTKESLSLLLKKIGFKIESFKNVQTNFEVIAIKSELQQKKIRVGVVMQSPDRGGAETFMTSLIGELSKDNQILTVSDSKEFLSFTSKHSQTKKVNLTMDIIGNKRGIIKTLILLPYAFYIYSNILRWFKREKVQVILMSNFTEKVFVTFLSLLFSIPVVWIEYGKLNTVLGKNLGFPKIIYRLAGRIPYAIIVPTVFTKNSLIKDAHISLAKIHTIPLGIEPPKSSGKNSHVNKFVIGSVSRLAKEKGQQYLIKAMPKILKSIPNAKALIVGDGPDTNRLKNLTRDLKLEKYVEFTGFAKKLDEQYSQMNIFVFPTVWDMEGFGLVLPEAMMRKIPVIASDIEPITAVVQEGKTAMLVEPGNPSKIADAVIELYQNPKLAQQISDDAYKYALQNYTIEESSKKIKDILYEATIH
jgi:glycosyltransferase involved in cell wall biosynthesis